MRFQSKHHKSHKKQWLLSAGSLFICLAIFTGIIAADQTPITKANYELPARFSPSKVRKMVFSTYVSPRWLKHSNQFWYSYETSDGKTLYIVDPIQKTKKKIFDNDKMAAQLTKLTKDPYDALHLPIQSIKFIKKDKFIYFKVPKNKAIIDAEKRKEEREKKEKEKDKKKDEKDKQKNVEKKENVKKEDQKDIQKKDVQKKDTQKKDKKEKLKEKDKKDKKKEDEKSAVEKAKEEAKKFHHFEYELATGKLTLLKDFVDKPKRPRWANISPDGKTVIFGKNYNLYSMNKVDYEKWLKDPKDETIKETQLTKDGEEYFSYHSSGYGESNVDKEKNKDKRKSAYVVWSRDSKKIAIERSDSRHVKDLWVINSVAKPRPTLQTYKYQMPGEKEAPQTEVKIYDLKSKKMVPVKTEKFKDQTVRLMYGSYPKNSYSDDYHAPIWLSETPDKLYFSRTSRDLKRIDICYADSETGDIKVLIEERLNTYVETRRLGFINNGKELVQWSERDGWAHFYLYNGEGKLKKQLTSGPWHCNSISAIDEKNRVMYFTANGREKGEDPYFSHFYKINLDGTGLTLLNKGNFTHSSNMDESKRFFLDSFSRVDTAPQTNLYDRNGRKLLDLEKTDLSLLFEKGYKFPETFKAKADDGITDIYGVIYKPFNFDETKKYPIIAYVYPGPQTEAVNKAFSTRMDRLDRLAQFGFIVVTLGNRGGHPSRSKWYHNYGYGNLRDYGLADKKAVIEHLAARHPFIDLDKVGIFGHSGGGFMSTAALLVYPDFFKVAVSSSGNHENNIYNRWWSEKHHGVEEIEDKDGNITFKYDIAKNSEIAKNLKGRLLITTGDIDNNVHPGNTIRLANALIKANKRFDFFLFPGQRHGYGNMTDYFFWLRADYFCKHLIGSYTDDVDIKQMNVEKEQKK